MDYLAALLLGVIQALTEFLPISSSAHLILWREWMAFESVDGLTFDVALHLGTALALIMYFRRDLRRLVVGFLASLTRPDLKNDFEQRLPWYIVAGSVPAVVVGLTLEDLIEHVFRAPAVIVATLAGGSILFLVTERVCRHAGTIRNVTLARSLIIGTAQCLALVPGVSRSGITIVGGMFVGLDRAEAARFSFLLSIPIVVGAGCKKLLELRSLSVTGHDVGVLVTGAIVATVAGWLVIRFLLRFLATHRLDVFAYYRLVLAAGVLLWMMS